ncbi:MAG: nitrogen regulation protein NR(II) [Kofleriaceae bacterium]
MRSQELVSGTSLATNAPVATSAPSPDAFWRGYRNEYFVEEASATTRLTVTAGVLVHASVLAMFANAGYPTWRLVSFATLFVIFAVTHRLIVRVVRDPQRVENAFILMNVTAQLFVVGSATLTGGVHSPFLPNLVLPSIVSLLFFGPYPVARWTAVGNGLLIIAMVSLPESVVGKALPPTEYTAAVLLSIGWHLFMLHLMVGKLTVVSNRAGDSMACLREERVSEAVARLQRLQSVGAKVAHELKNPLASIKGLCQLVARTPESERTQERLAVVASEISRMETILGEYLSYSRPLEDIKPEALDLGVLARDVLDVLAGRADQAGVELSLDGSAPPVQGDPRRLKEALINLVANAIEATPHGGAVALRLTSGSGNVALEVRDTGRGIAADDLERLGTSFFTTRSNGTGLGVVLAQGVITQHGGSLGYQSTVGSGTVATIVLPVKSGATPEPAPRAAMIEARA